MLVPDACALSIVMAKASIPRLEKCMASPYVEVDHAVGEAEYFSFLLFVILPWALLNNTSGSIFHSSYNPHIVSFVLLFFEEQHRLSTS